jgi:hypothetical protein
MALQHFEAISLRHRDAYLMTNPPRCFICDAERAPHLFAADAVARRNKQIDRIEPSLQRRVTVLKDRARAGVDMIAALRARIGAALRELVERRISVALDADMPQPVADIHDPLEASIIGWEPGEELLDRKCLYGTGLFSDLGRAMALARDGELLPLCIPQSRTRQGDNPHLGSRRQQTNPLSERWARTSSSG